MKPLLAVLSSSLAVTLLAGAPALAQQLPFEGEWDCDGVPMTFVDGQCHSGENGPFVNIHRVVSSGNDYTLTLTDGYRFNLFGVEDATMTWISQETGDILDCRRTAAAPVIQPGAESWSGMRTQGITEAHVVGAGDPGISIGVSCSSIEPQADNAVYFRWDGNDPASELRVSVDGGPITVYPASNGAVSSSTPGFRALLEA